MGSKKPVLRAKTGGPNVADRLQNMNDISLGGTWLWLYLADFWSPLLRFLR
jgi:hypothetical protein